MQVEKRIFLLRGYAREFVPLIARLCRMHIALNRFLVCIVIILLAAYVLVYTLAFPQNSGVKCLGCNDQNRVGRLQTRGKTRFPTKWPVY